MCIGQLTFVELIATRHPAYAEAPSKLESDHSFLDVDGCLGQNVRKLLCDGTPSSSAMYGLDAESAFFDLGFEIFRHRHTINNISAHIHSHLFTLEDQKTVVQHLVRLINSETSSNGYRTTSRSY